MARLRREELNPFPRELQPRLNAIQQKINDSRIVRQQCQGLAPFQKGIVILLSSLQCQQRCLPVVTESYTVESHCGVGCVQDVLLHGGWICAQP